MKIAVSTHWNTHQHRDGRAVIEEILNAGFCSVELGYDLTLDLVEGVTSMVKENAVNVTSLHNFCPVPTGAPMGHPELFDLSSTDSRMRAAAVKNTIQTIEFAAAVNAQAVVLHCGYVRVKNMTARLIDMAREGELFSKKYEKVKTKLILKRGKAAEKTMDCLRLSIEELLPKAEAGKVKLCPENLPLWESVPSENEMMELLEEFSSPWLGYWHDMGHGQIRTELGFSNQHAWLKRLKPTGYHVHDMDDDFRDHLMPPRGKMDFSAFKETLDSDSLLILEPAPGTPTEYLIEAANYLKTCWNMEKQ